MTLERAFDPTDAALLHLMSRLQGVPELTGLQIIDRPPDAGEDDGSLFVYRYSGGQIGGTVDRVGVESNAVETWAVALLVDEGGDQALAAARLAAARATLIGSGGRNASGCVLACSRTRSERELDPDASGRRWIRRYDLYRLVVGP